MKKYRHKLVLIYSMLGFMLILAILITQLMTKFNSARLAPQIINTSDSIESNTDTLDYNWKDVGY